MALLMLLFSNLHLVVCILVLVRRQPADVEAGLHGFTNPLASKSDHGWGLERGSHLVAVQHTSRDDCLHDCIPSQLDASICGTTPGWHMAMLMWQCPERASCHTPQIYEHYVSDNCCSLQTHLPVPMCAGCEAPLGLLVCVFHGRQCCTCEDGTDEATDGGPQEVKSFCR